MRKIMESYRTLASEATANYEIQKSKFIAYVAPVETEEAAREFVTAIKKKHFDARHNCSAWILGADGNRQKSNDDGEPGGTAGNPILEAIKQHGLTNTVVVVTRYFGGIKLGAGGLIRAYNHTASLGLEAAPILETKPFVRLACAVDYSLLAPLENWLRRENIRTLPTEYADKVTLQLLVEPQELDGIMATLTDMTAGRSQLTAHEPEYLSIPVEN